MAMKVTDPKNQIWYMEDGQSCKIGFTKSFLQSMEECWHILPSSNDKITKKAPLLTVETNDALLSILSPVSGFFGTYNPKARDFPNKLLENDVILEVVYQKAESVAVPATASAPTLDRRWDLNNVQREQLQRMIEAGRLDNGTAQWGQTEPMEFAAPIPHPPVPQGLHPAGTGPRPRNPITATAPAPRMPRNRNNQGSF